MEKQVTTSTKFETKVGGIPLAIEIETCEGNKPIIKFYSDNHFRFQLLEDGSLLKFFTTLTGELLKLQVDQAGKQMLLDIDMALQVQKQQTVPSLLYNKLFLTNQNIGDSVAVTDGTPLEKPTLVPYVTTGYIGKTSIDIPIVDRDTKSTEEVNE